jgi:predicted RNA-binding Zn-ribbon protein involved in translation (DUF1610 family)
MNTIQELLVQIKCPKCGEKEYLHTCVHTHDLNTYYQCNRCLFKEDIQQLCIREV